MHVQIGLVDRASLAVVVLDVQRKLAAVMPRRREAVATVDRLVRAAALLGAPIVVTRQYPAGLGPTCPEIAAALEEAKAAVPVLEIDKVCSAPATSPTSSGRCGRWSGRSLL